ncbi:hypothetical protein EDC04DRAFT_3004990, partial [Pisolithus marmoratus]
KPSGKLSLTFPKWLEDIPSHGHFSSENRIVQYAEDLFFISSCLHSMVHLTRDDLVGVQASHLQRDSPAVRIWAHHRHGLSYTMFLNSDLKLSEPNHN